MFTQQPLPNPTAEPANAEIIRLRQQLVAREEAIRQLTQRIAEVPQAGYLDVPDSDQDELADALASGIELQTEIHRLRGEATEREAEIAALRHQLGVYDRLGLSVAVGSVQKVRRLWRKPGTRT